MRGFCNEVFRLTKGSVEARNESIESLSERCHFRRDRRRHWTKVCRAAARHGGGDDVKGAHAAARCPNGKDRCDCKKDKANQYCSPRDFTKLLRQSILSLGDSDSDCCEATVDGKGTRNLDQTYRFTSIFRCP